MSTTPAKPIANILLLLDPKDLIRCTSVSKAWYAFIHSQKFIKAHLESSTKANSSRAILLTQYQWEDKLHGCSSAVTSLAFNGDDSFGTAVKLEQRPLERRDRHAVILGYSNGLVCIVNTDINSVYGNDFGAFWNPSIQKMKKIPPTTLEWQASEDSEIKRRGLPRYGFGYDSVHDDYKLVGIAESVNEDHVVVSSEAKVYSLNSKSWKKIQNLPFGGFQFYSDSMVFSNGALSWLMHSQSDHSRFIIATLDIASEEYEEFSTPVEDDGSSFLSLEVLGDHLCLCITDFATRYDIWIMKEYGVNESWTRICSIEKYSVVASFCRPVAFSKNGGMILLQRRVEGCTVLSWYDLEKRSVDEGVEVCGLPSAFQTTTVCRGSLCLLDGDLVVDGRQQQKQKQRRNR